MGEFTGFIRKFEKNEKNDGFRGLLSEGGSESSLPSPPFLEN